MRIARLRFFGILKYMDRLKKYILWVLCFSLYACIADDEEIGEGNNLMVGDRIPNFSVVMNDGSKVQDKDLLGKVSLIVFFHTDCTDCQQELPVLQRFYEAHSQYPLICISRAESAESVAQYWKKALLTLPYSAQENREVYHLFASQGIPRIYVVDMEGFIRVLFTDNPLASYEDLVKAVRGI